MDEKKVSIAVWLPGRPARSLAWSQLFSCCGDSGRPPLFSPVDSNHPYETGHLGIPNPQTKPYINILVYQLKYNNIYHITTIVYQKCSYNKIISHYINILKTNCYCYTMWDTLESRICIQNCDGFPICDGSTGAGRMAYPIYLSSSLVRQPRK